uniref:Reverse transcriptase domain-containing protein n=1 Tax=Tanacetum cinerariifolium TaxID=118510 RepID=A0A6L2M1C9_TANCI|nr:hypothetical protein [Tanacetum cinerariifolium]
MNYFESNPCYDSNYFGIDQIEPSQSVNQPLNIQNELDNHKLFINELIQQKLQNEYAQPFSAIAITFDSPTVEPEESLRMGDEHLDTISEIESDEFIKSSVENLVPNPSESEDEHECDVPVCDDFTTFSNILFDADDDFSSSDNESFSDEDIPKELYSNPLLDEEIISIKIDLHHFNAEIACNNSLSFPKNESFHFDSPSSPRPPAEPSNDDEIKPILGMLIFKVVGDISKQYVPMTRLFPTQPTLFSNQEKSPHLLSHRGLKAFQLPSECPMRIYGGNSPVLDVPFHHFYPL